MNGLIQGIVSLVTKKVLPLKASDNGDGTGTLLVTNSAAAPYTPRSSLKGTGTAGQIVVVSGDPAPFTVAYFYGLKAVPDDGAAVTANAASVWLGEMIDGAKQLVDEVTNDPANPVIVRAAPGKSLDLADFWIRIPTNGDGYYVKYQ